MMLNQDFRFQKIFQKHKQLGGYHHLILLQNFPTLDVAGILVLPVLSVLNTWSKTLEKYLRSPWEFHSKYLLNASSKIVGNLFLRWNGD